MITNLITLPLLAGTMLSVPMAYAAEEAQVNIAGINLKGNITPSSQGVNKEDIHLYEKEMVTFKLKDTAQFGFKVDNAYVFTSPISHKILFIETRTEIEKGSCNSFKRAFDSYISSNLKSSQLIEYDTQELGKGFVDLTASTTYTSTCFASRTDENGFVYPDEFVGNFTDSKSWETYTKEKDAILTSSN